MSYCKVINVLILSATNFSTRIAHPKTTGVGGRARQIGLVAGFVRSVAAIVLVCATYSAAATVTLDQSNWAPEASYGGQQIYNNGATGATAVEGAQSFTVGISGYFDHFSLLLGSFGYEPVTLRLRHVTAGVVDSNNSLAIASVAGVMPLWTNGFTYHTAVFDLSSLGIHANVGEVYAISLESGPSTPFGGWASGGSYAGGRAFGRNGSTSVWGGSIGGGADNYFQTYMTDTPGAAAAPEPATFFLACSALMGLWGSGRARQIRARCA